MKNKKIKYFASCLGLLGLGACAVVSAVATQNNSNTSLNNTNKEIEREVPRFQKQVVVNQALFSTRGTTSASDFFEGSRIKGNINYSISTIGEVIIIGHDNNFSGNDITFKETVNINNKEYKIVGVAENAFNGCTSFAGCVTFPSSLREISKAAFKGTSITQIKFADQSQLVNICDSAFESIAIDGLPTPLTVCFPNSLNFIGKKAFANWKYYGEFDFSQATKLMQIDDHAFSNCANVFGTITIPSSLISVDHAAFEGCVNVDKLVLPVGNSLTEIGSEAFMNVGANKVNSQVIVNISYKLQSIAIRAFYGCRVTDINVSNSNYALASNVGSAKVLISRSAYRNQELKLDESCSNVVGSLACGDLVLSNTTCEIIESAFAGCGGLTSVKLPKTSLEAICKYAFNDCYSLNTYEWAIPESVKKIGTNAFNGAPKINFLSEKAPQFEYNWLNVNSSEANEKAQVLVPYTEDASIVKEYANAKNFTLNSSYVNNGLDFIELEWNAPQSYHYLGDTTEIRVEPNKGMAPNSEGAAKARQFNWNTVSFFIEGKKQWVNGASNSLNSGISEYMSIKYKEIGSSENDELPYIIFGADFLKPTSGALIDIQTKYEMDNYSGNGVKSHTIDSSIEQLVIYNQITELKVDQVENAESEETKEIVQENVTDINITPNSIFTLEANINKDANPNATIEWSSNAPEGAIEFLDETKTGDALNFKVNDINQNGTIVINAKCNNIEKSITLHYGSNPSKQSNLTWLWILLGCLTVVAFAVPLTIYLAKLNKAKKTHSNNNNAQ